VLRSGAGWFCDKVVVREIADTDGDSRLFYFPCGQWLDRAKSDGLIERSLLPQQPPELVQEPSELVQEEPKSQFKSYLFTSTVNSFITFTPLL